MATFTVLMIDDEVNYPTAFKLLLETKGDNAVYLASNGQEGLEMARDKKPDLIFLDVMMPGIDGIEVLKSIRADKELKNIPVIMLTAVQTEKARAETLRLNVEGYLNKPLEMEVLLGKIDEIKNRSKTI